LAERKGKKRPRKKRPNLTRQIRSYPFEISLILFLFN
jgi:hypothetical protein